MLRTRRRAATPPHAVTQHNHQAQPEAERRQQQLIRQAEQNAHVGVDAPAGQFGDERESVEPHLIDDGEALRRDGDRVHLRRPAAIYFGHRPGFALAFRLTQLDLSGVYSGGARGVQRPIPVAIQRIGLCGRVHLHARHHTAVLGVRIGRRLRRIGLQAGVDLRRQPAQVGPQRVDVAAGPLRPGQPGGREEQQPGQQRHAQRDMPMAAGGKAPFRPFQLALRPRRQPQRHAAQGGHPQPGGRQFAVVAPQIAKQQAAVQLIQPGAQRQHAGGAVHRHIPLDCQSVRIDKQRARLGSAQIGTRELHTRGVRCTGRRAHGVNARLVTRHTAGGGDLVGQRSRVPVRLGRQRIAIQRLFKLRGQHIQRAGQCGDQNKRGDQQADIKMQPSDQVQHRASRRCGRWSFGYRRHGLSRFSNCARRQTVRSDTNGVTHDQAIRKNGWPGGPRGLGRRARRRMGGGTMRGAQGRRAMRVISHSSGTNTHNSSGTWISSSQ
ncbi:Uncharacterised protein [Serratia marcescens]|nr:Uncharacterised protein [Serratia marcescens]